MIVSITGKTNCGKGKKIRELIREEKQPVVILDFKNDYNDIDGVVINLGLIDPFLSSLDFEDSVAVNSGLIEYSQFLKNRSEEVLKDFCPKDLNWNTFRMRDLIDESLKRASNGWDLNENARAKESRRFLNFKKSKQELVLEEELDRIGESDIVILKTEGLHSIQTRVLTFLFLKRLQEVYPSFTVVSDNINYLWRDGHLFLFSKIFNFENNKLILSLNKTANFPKKLLPYVEDVLVYQLESNSDVDFFKELDLPVDSKAKRFRIGKYEQFSLKKEEVYN